MWKFRDRSTEISSDEKTVDSSYEDIVAAAEEFDKIVENETFPESNYGAMDEFEPSKLDVKEEFGDEELLKKYISNLHK